MRTAPLEFPQLLQEFFLRHLISQRGASPATIASYRQAFELLFRFAQRRLGRPPSELVLADFDGPLVLDFLDDLEAKRGNAPRTRNARLAAIHSFARYASMRAPDSLPALRRVLAVPSKRFDRPLLGYLTRPEVEAVLAAPDRTTWSGRRDVILLTLLYNTGARLSDVGSGNSGSTNSGNSDPGHKVLSAPRVKTHAVAEAAPMVVPRRDDRRHEAARGAGPAKRGAVQPSDRAAHRAGQVERASNRKGGARGRSR